MVVTQNHVPNAPNDPNSTHKSVSSAPAHAQGVGRAWAGVLLTSFGVHFRGRGASWGRLGKSLGCLRCPLVVSISTKICPRTGLWSWPCLWNTVWRNLPPPNWDRERPKCFTGYISNDFRLCTLGSDLALLLAPFWSYFCTTDRSQVANNAA